MCRNPWLIQPQLVAFLTSLLPGPSIILLFEHSPAVAAQIAHLTGFFAQLPSHSWLLSATLCPGCKVRHCCSLALLWCSSPAVSWLSEAGLVPSFQPEHYGLDEGCWGGDETNVWIFHGFAKCSLFCPHFTGGGLILLTKLIFRLLIVLR